jgi:MerR family mercuric resistance operon transcriptional regulator
MTRGQLARTTGANVETVRFYEKIGLMPDPPRSAGGHRIYDDGHVHRLRFILRGRGLGFSVEQVKELLGLVDSDAVTCEEVRAMTLRHLRTVREKIADLTRLEQVLAETADRCTGGKTPDCPVIQALAGEDSAPRNASDLG